jgi:hypothetical protein
MPSEKFMFNGGGEMKFYHAMSFLVLAAFVSSVYFGVRGLIEWNEAMMVSHAILLAAGWHWYEFTDKMHTQENAYAD